MDRPDAIHERAQRRWRGQPKFTVAAGLLTIAPGLDTARVAKTAICDGARRAFMAELGIIADCFAWGKVLVAVGLGTLLQTSALAYEILRWIGAMYLLHLGLKLIRSPRSQFELGGEALAPTSSLRWWRVNLKGTPHFRRAAADCGGKRTGCFCIGRGT